MSMPASASYPYLLRPYRKAHEILMFDMFGEISMNDLLRDRSLKSILEDASKRCATAHEQCKKYDGRWLAPPETYTKALEALVQVLPDDKSMGYFMETVKTDWPNHKEVCEKTFRLNATPFGLTYHLIPDGEKDKVRDLFASDELDFFGKVGQYTLKDYFTRPHAEFTKAQVDVFAQARRRGVLLCHPGRNESYNEHPVMAELVVELGSDSLTMMDPTGSCWNGSECVESSDPLDDCTGDAVGSDLCD